MDLVKAFRNNVFTDSMTIAVGTGNAHHSITRVIENMKMIFCVLERLDLKSKLQTADKAKRYIH